MNLNISSQIDIKIWNQASCSWVRVSTTKQVMVTYLLVGCIIRTGEALFDCTYPSMSEVNDAFNMVSSKLTGEE